MQPALLGEHRIREPCAAGSNADALVEGDMLVVHEQLLCCMWTDGCTRADKEQDTQDHVRGRGDSKQWEQGLLSEHRLGCAQHATQRGMHTFWVAR